MAICAHELTFRDLGKDGFLTLVPPEERADLGDFDGSRQMVPRHHGRRKDPPAIGAWLVALEIEIPRPEFTVALLLLSEASRTGPLVIFAVVFLSARFAPSLLAVPSAAMKLADGLPFATSET